MRQIMFKSILGFAMLGMAGGRAWATYSIVAVDTVTKEVGGAGASCLETNPIAVGGVLIINDIFPGKGAIHTQAQWDSTNQRNAHAQMAAGKSPQEIIDFLSKNDSQNMP